MVYRPSGILFTHKKNEILSFVTTWISLEHIMSSEISQAHKDKKYVFSRKIKKNDLVEVENRIVVTRGWEK